MNAPVSQFDIIKAQLRSEDVVMRFAEVMGDHQARGYVASVLIAVQNNEALAKCTPNSILTSAMRAATLRLSCDPSLGQAHLVPFKGKATLVVGYKGLKDLALRTGKYRYLNIATIYEGMEVHEDEIKGIHTLTGARKCDNAIGYMLYFELFAGFSKTFYMTVEEIDAHAQRYSASINFDSSPWKTHRPEMRKKTVMRLGLSKWGYFDPQDAANLAQSDEAESETFDAETIDYVPDPPQSMLQNMSELGFDMEPPAGQVNVFAGGKKSAPQP
jgi:recombination protein RecT